MTLFKKYGCGCIGIPIEQITDPNGDKAEKALCIHVCDRSQYELPEDGEMDGLVERSVLLEGKDRFVTAEEQAELLDKVRRQMAMGARFMALKRMLT